MRIGLCILCTLSLSAVTLGRLVRGGHTWVILGPSELDQRIHRQIEQLAAHDQALARFARTSREAARYRGKPGNILIELREEKNAETFLKTLTREAGDSTLEPTIELAKQGYVLEAYYPHASVPNRIRITAPSAEGFHDALLRVPDLLLIWPNGLGSKLIPPARSVRVQKNGAEVRVADYPALPERGIVEGFYGRPWSHQERLEMLRFEGQHAMNVYYYAPKDDPYHRTLWRDAYPSAEMKRLGELVETAHRNFVDFCFAISPGLSMSYSSEQDFGVLTRKLASVEKLGVSCFALFLDDVPQDLQSAQDQAQFKTLAQAHVFLINKLYRHLKSQSASNRLTVTPTTYTNAWGNRDYIKELGAGVDPGVAIVWTGPDVASPKITVAQAKEWGGFLHRKPLVWDNFPVNDGRPWRVHLGPMRGREADLPTVIQGLFSNPMNQARASMLPLQTVADYLWNSHAYNPDKSVTHAIAGQYGKEGVKLMTPLLKIYGDYWWDENLFTPLFAERRYAIDVTKIESQIGLLDGSLGALKGRLEFGTLLSEISPFPGRMRKRLADVRSDAAYRQLPDEKLQWREDYDVLTAVRFPSPPNLDGDFSKWQSGLIYELNKNSQIVRGRKMWQGPNQISARVGLGWDNDYLYVGVDASDSEVYQPFFGRGIDKGDAFVIYLETAFRKNFQATEPTGNEYHLFFSPGNFSNVKTSVFSDEDYLPPRPQPHDYNKEIRTAWRKTATGFSGDIAFPVTFFDGAAFSKGYEIGLAFGIQKAIPPRTASPYEEPERIVFTSKLDPLFHVSLGNPSSYPRLVLVDAR